MGWNASLYQSSHSFVWEYGRELLNLLEPKTGERILDVGCGTGQLAAEMARSGAETVGIDSSPAMVAQARGNFPELRFEVADVTALPYHAEFDAIFSNAALHWVRQADTAAAGMARALKPDGRLVAEFGGHGNIQGLLEAAYRALESLGVAGPEKHNPWYFPTIGEYAAVLGGHGMDVTYAVLFDRLTPLEDDEQGLENWIAMFGAPLTGVLREEQREEFLRLVERNAQPRLWREGKWWADYRRLRVMGRKPG